MGSRIPDVAPSYRVKIHHWRRQKSGITESFLHINSFQTGSKWFPHSARRAAEPVNDFTCLTRRPDQAHQAHVLGLGAIFSFWFPPTDTCIIVMKSHIFLNFSNAASPVDGGISGHIRTKSKLEPNPVSLRPGSQSVWQLLTHNETLLNDKQEVGDSATVI